ncbi:MAG: PDZ domain-containing protein [Bacillota bacterium]|jgi:PDZ domain-containing protein|nr:PDZ domain-containing protein [Bacillota bacterium]HHU30630.1 PDZ domain-containing protein [Bacillota bacterium]
MKKLARYALIVLVVAGLLFLRTGYLVVRPGSALDLSTLVSVESVTGEEDEGSFCLVTVVQKEATPLQLLQAIFDSGVDLRHKSRYIPPGLNKEEYREIMKQWMIESQTLAKVIALRKKGYEVPVKSDGIKVVRIEEDSPARGILQPGDVIVAVDGKEVYLVEELIEEVGARPAGSPVTLTVRRDSEIKELTVNTVTHSQQPDKAGIRAYVQTLNWQPVLPLEIDIQVGKITGPSAGLMFVLEILNQLDEKDLTFGHKIAGTGTINLEEEVGSIGGVRQKVRAAEEADAEYFLVPEKNYEEAKNNARTVTVVAVRTLDEALHFLEGLSGSSN